MRLTLTRAPLLLALAAALACNKEDVQAADRQVREAGRKVGAELEQALDELESFAKAAAAKAGESGEALAQSVEEKMPETEQLVAGTKQQLAAGGEKAKELGARLDQKLATLKVRLQTLSQSAAAATKEMKDDVVTAYQDLMAEIRTDLKPAG